MGTIAIYLRVSENKLGQYLKVPATLKNELDDYNRGIDNTTVLNLIDIDKAWAGLFYLLTGQSANTPNEASPPLRWILDAPQYIDSNQDLGYGPALYTTCGQTKQVSAALSNISEGQLKKNWNVDLMNELSVYPFEDGNWSEDELEYLTQAFNRLKEFYRKAAADNEAVIQFFG